jgi:hypothetical protein
LAGFTSSTGTYGAVPYARLAPANPMPSIIVFDELAIQRTTSVASAPGAVDFQRSSSLGDYASGPDSFIAGSSYCGTSGTFSVALGSSHSRAMSSNSGVFCTHASIVEAALSYIGGGDGNSIGTTGHSSHIGGGANNKLGDTAAFSQSSGIMAGDNGIVRAVQSAIVCGLSNTVTGNRSAIGAGSGGSVSSSDSFISAGTSNQVSGVNSFVGAGSTNRIILTSSESAIIAGINNTVSSSIRSGIVSGGSNTIDSASSNSCVVSGANNTITSCVSSAILTGDTNMVGLGGDRSAIVSGRDNITQQPDVMLAGIGLATLPSDTGYGRAIVGRYNLENTVALIGPTLPYSVAPFPSLIQSSTVPNTTTNQRIFVVGNGTSAVSRNNAFSVLNDGSAVSGGKVVVANGSADFAEYFETESGEKLMVGTPVVFTGKGRTIRPSLPDELPFGVVSNTAAYIANAGGEEWTNKYLSDKDGNPVFETVDIEEEEDVTEIVTETRMSKVFDGVWKLVKQTVDVPHRVMERRNH